MCVGCVHRHGVVKLVALVVRERRVVRRSGPLGSRPLVLCVLVHGLRHRRGLCRLGVLAVGSCVWMTRETLLCNDRQQLLQDVSRTETCCNIAFFVFKNLHQDTQVILELTQWTPVNGLAQD